MVRATTDAPVEIPAAVRDGNSMVADNGVSGSLNAADLLRQLEAANAKLAALEHPPAPIDDGRYQPRPERYDQLLALLTEERGKAEEDRRWSRGDKGLLFDAIIRLNQFDEAIKLVKLAADLPVDEEGNCAFRQFGKRDNPDWWVVLPPNMATFAAEEFGNRRIQAGNYRVVTDNPIWVAGLLMLDDVEELEVGTQACHTKFGFMGWEKPDIAGRFHYSGASRGW